MKITFLPSRCFFPSPLSLSSWSLRVSCFLLFPYFPLGSSSALLSVLSSVLSSGMFPRWAFPFLARSRLLDPPLLVFSLLTVIDAFVSALSLVVLFQEYEEPVYSYSTYPVRRSPRDIHNIFKMSPPFASSEGVSVSGDRYQSDVACRTQPQRHCLLSRCRVRTCCSIALTFSFSFCLFLPYLSLFSFSFHPKSDISAL